MPDFDVDWVDAFADRPFGGNGCAVVHGAVGLDDATCMAFVRETSLVECTFLGPSDVADVHVRYFLANGEIPFAGHPTVATVASLIHRSISRGPSLCLETGAGVIPVEITHRNGPPLIKMTQNAPAFGAKPDPDLVARAIGLDAGRLAAPPQVVSTGLPFVVTVLRDKRALHEACLNVEALTSLREAIGTEAEFTEPFLVTLGGETPQGSTFSRLLLPPPSPPEDPFTGSATGAMAAYLWRYGLLDTPSFVAEQGHWMGRPGTARVDVLGPPDRISGVRVGGTGHVLISGQLRL